MGLKTKYHKYLLITVNHFRLAFTTQIMHFYQTQQDSFGTKKTTSPIQGFLSEFEDCLGMTEFLS